MARPVYWTEEKIVEAYRAFYDRHGRYPTLRDVDLDRSLPNQTTVYRVCGSHTNAQVLAFDDYHPQDAQVMFHNDTEEVMRQMAEGRTLTSLARERGISSQSLGRRVRRYKARAARAWSSE